MSAGVVAVFVLAAAALAFVVAPLLRADAIVAERRRDNFGEERDLLARHTMLLASLRDLEEDRSTDKLDQVDYDRLKHQLSGEAIEIMKRLDGLRARRAQNHQRGDAAAERSG